MKGHKEFSLRGVSDYIDKGYGSLGLLKGSLAREMGCVMIMPKRVLAYHLFVSKSYFRGRKYKEDVMMYCLCKAMDFT